MDASFLVLFLPFFGMSMFLCRKLVLSQHGEVVLSGLKLMLWPGPIGLSLWYKPSIVLKPGAIGLPTLLAHHQLLQY